jgi:hypothetical protein
MGKSDSHKRSLVELGRQVLHHIQLKYHYGRSFSFRKNEFCKKTDDHILYF